MAEDTKKNVPAEADTTAAKSDEKKASPKKNKPSFKDRIAKAFREFRAEMKKIIWYSREQTFKSTVVVIVSIVIASAFTGCLDFLFSQGIRWLGSLV